MKRYTKFLDWKNQYCQNYYNTQGNLQIQCNSYQITIGKLTYDKGGKTIQWRKESLFNKWCLANWTATYKNKIKISFNTIQNRFMT